MRIIGKPNGQRVTVLLIEQFAAAARSVADHGYVWEHGGIAAHALATALRNDPSVKAAYLGASH